MQSVESSAWPGDYSVAVRYLACAPDCEAAASTGVVVSDGASYVVLALTAIQAWYWLSLTVPCQSEQIAD